MAKRDNKNNNGDGDIPNKNKKMKSKKIINETEAIKMLNNLLKNSIKKNLELKQERFSDYGNLIAAVSEWLDCFIIIGYDLKGDGVVLGNPKSIKDQNSLNELLKNVFIDIMSKNQ